MRDFPFPGSEGKKYTPKVFSAVKTQVLQQAKKGLVYTKKLVFKGKKKENTYTPKRLQGVCDPFAQYWCIDVGLLLVFPFGTRS